MNCLQRYGCNLLFIHAVMFFTPKNCNQSMEIIILLKKESKLKAMMCNIYVNNILFPMRDAKRIRILTSYFKFKRGNALGQIAFISCQLNQRLDCSFLLRQDLNYYSALSLRNQLQQTGKNTKPTSRWLHTKILYMSCAVWNIISEACFREYKQTWVHLKALSIMIL